MLRAGYEADHDLDVEWEWAYQVGESHIRVPLEREQGHPDDAYRDPAAERAVLAGLEAPLEPFGLCHTAHEAGRRTPVLEPWARLEGMDTMRFTTEAIPLLSDTPSVRPVFGDVPVGVLLGREASGAGAQCAMSGCGPQLGSRCRNPNC